MDGQDLNSGDKGKRHKGTAEERAQQGALILQDRLNGLSFQQIADKMGKKKSKVHETYKRYMADYAADHIKSQQAVIGEYNSQSERIITLMLAAFQHSQKKARIKDAEAVGDISILAELRTTVNARFDRLQSAGCAPKAAEKVAATINGEVRYPRPEVYLDELLRLEAERGKKEAAAANAGRSVEHPQ